MLGYCGLVLAVFSISFCAHVTAATSNETYQDTLQEMGKYFDFTTDIDIALDDIHGVQVGLFSCAIQDDFYEIEEVPLDSSDDDTTDGRVVDIVESGIDSAATASTAATNESTFDSSETGDSEVSAEIMLSETLQPTSISVPVVAISQPPNQETTQTTTSQTSTTTTTNNNFNPLAGLIGWIYHDEIQEEEPNTLRFPKMDFQVLNVEPVLNSHWKITFYIKSLYDPVLLFETLGSDPVTVDLGYSNNGYATSLRLFGAGAKYNYSNPFDIQASVLVAPTVHGDYFCLPNDFGFTYQIVPLASLWSTVFHSVFKYFVNTDLQDYGSTIEDVGEADEIDEISELNDSGMLGVTISNFVGKFLFV